MLPQSCSVCLTLALALSCTAGSVLAQVRPLTRRSLTVTPAKATLGRPVVISVQGAPQRGGYRFFATMTATGAGERPGAGCPNNLNLGSGASVSWTPASGTYRLTAFGPLGQETDTLSQTYVVQAPRVMLATQTQGGSVPLVLRTDDLGPGHKYHWAMQYSATSATGGGTAQQTQSQPWTAQTSGPLVTYPTAVPTAAAIKASVGIHRGNPCEIIAAGFIPSQ